MSSTRRTTAYKPTFTFGGPRGSKASTSAGGGFDDDADFRRGSGKRYAVVLPKIGHMLNIVKTIRKGVIDKKLKANLRMIEDRNTEYSTIVLTSYELHCAGVVRSNVNERKID